MERWRLVSNYWRAGPTAVFVEREHLPMSACREHAFEAPTSGALHLATHLPAAVLQIHLLAGEFEWEAVMEAVMEHQAGGGPSAGEWEGPPDGGGEERRGALT